MIDPVRSGLRRTPPYGPAKGMLEGLQLLRRSNPAVVNEDFLRANGVAPNNEYKVIGALRYLDLIDGDGRPTDKSRLLKTRGAAYTLNLQRIVREAYGDLLRQVDLKRANRDLIHNYFVTEGGLGAEMATKAARFFLELCKLAELEIGEAPKPGRARMASAGSAGRLPEGVVPLRESADFRWGMPFMPGFGSPFTITITPEIAQLNEEELAEVFRKVMNALRRAMLP